MREATSRIDKDTDPDLIMGVVMVEMAETETEKTTVALRLATSFLRRQKDKVKDTGIGTLMSSDYWIVGKWTLRPPDPPMKISIGPEKSAGLYMPSIEDRWITDFTYEIVKDTVVLTRGEAQLTLRIDRNGKSLWTTGEPSLRFIKEREAGSPAGTSSSPESSQEPQQSQEKEIGDLIRELSQGVEASSKAGWSLFKIGKPAVPALVEALGSEDYQVRTSAINTLALIKDPRAVDPLVNLLRTCEKGDRYFVAVALGHIGSPRALQALQKLEEYPDPRLKRAASQAIRLIKGKQEDAERTDPGDRE